jgi:hypothetical protein
MRRLLLLITTMAMLLLSLLPPAHATWYGENVANGADMMMMDVRWPWWPESTYFANWNFAFNPPGITGYGGFAIGAPTLDPDHRPNFDPEIQAALRPGSVWSFWGANKEGEPVRVIASSEYTYPRQYIGEGASGSLGGPTWPFIQQNRWYTMMMRVWQPIGVKNPQYAYLGRWVKDVGSRQWKLYGLVRLPVPATSFTSNAGFLEDFGNAGRSVRSMYRRLGYYRKDGQWRKSDTVTYDVPPGRGVMDTYWVVNKQEEGDHEILAMELSSNRALLPQKLHGATLELGKKHAFTVRQPAVPTLDPPQVTGVRAITNGRQVAVSWELPASSAPQFAYRIEIFDNPACKGRPAAVREERMPTVRTVLMNATIAQPTVRLTITDVFDQKAAPVSVKATAAPVPPKPTITRADPGLAYELLVQDASRHVNVFYPAGEKSDEGRGERHSWLSLAELKAGHRIQSGISRGFDTDLSGERPNSYAFRFRGLLRAPAGGLYLLHVQGSDGYRIRVDGREALLWDGPHGPTERTAVLNLTRGDHPLAVDYFVDQSPAPFFKLDWEGPGRPRQEIPRAALLHTRVGQEPETALTSQGNTDGTATLTVKVDPKGHRVAKVRLFLGKLQIAEASGPQLTFAGAMPQGKSDVWARLLYDTDHTLDTEPMPVTVTGPTVKGWDFAVVGEARALRGVWQTGPDAFSFFGEGEYVISRKAKGDFTLTCRVDAYAGAQGEPVNADSWVGLTAREDGSKPINVGWGREFGVMQTGRDGIRATPNSSDLGGARISDFALPNNRPWLRIVRWGNQWTAWTSADGVAWEHGATHFIPARNEMDAGLVFRALPQDARAYFQARVSHLTLVPGIAGDVVMPAPVPAKDTAGPRLTGVVMAPSDPNVVVVRSTNLGLLRSTDGGKSWMPANGQLVGAANSVRSVAIHPQDPRIMLRAAGRVGQNGAYEGGLSLTRDGGSTWEALNFPGDFDGEGPSALCGEVVGFDPATPQILFVGCETRGFFRSEDGGKTWKRIGAEGERITAITVNRWVRGTSDQAYIHVVTCPDVWMPLLGRGKAALSATVTVSRDYVSRDGGLSLQRTCERADLGYLNVAFDKGSLEALPYATTHGILKALADGDETFLFPSVKNLEVFRPVTALGCSGIDEGLCGRCLTQPLDPANPAQLSRSDFFAYNWDWKLLAGDRPAGGMIALCGEFKQGRLWWLLSTDGLYRSTDGGVTLRKVLDREGVRVRQ